MAQQALHAVRIDALAEELGGRAAAHVVEAHRACSRSTSLLRSPNSSPLRRPV
jgi:hypothetical protein